MAVFCTRVYETGGVVLERIGGEIRGPLPLSKRGGRHAGCLRNATTKAIHVRSTPF